MNISFDKKFIFFLLVCFLIFFQGILKLPVMDRDEARFATASKTMLMNNDYIDIQMIDEKRYKKPVGIYWAQALMNKIVGSYPYDKIWIYRLPSILGVFICMLMIFFFIKNLENENIAFFTVFFLIFSFLTISEIHQSKTDGLLFLFIGICNLLIYKLINFRKLIYWEKLFFWSAFAIGILIKGPIIIIFTLFPLLVFSIIKKKNYFKYIWSISGIILLLCVSVPWFVLINIKSGGLFWYESVGNDLLKKVRSGQESHGFPPGYYSLLIFLFFWPGSIFIINLIGNIKSNYKKIIKKNDFLFYLVISFLCPFILFELIPTKLPHYIYPSYLPLSILISKSIFENNLSSNTLKFSLAPLLIFPLAIISLIFFSIIQFSDFDFNCLFVTVILLIFTFLLFWLNIKGRVRLLIISSGCFQITIYFLLIFFLIPRLEKIWISEKINNIISFQGESVEKVFTIGFNEPSLLFLTSHKSSNSLADLGDFKIDDKKILLIITEEVYKKIGENINFSSFHLVEEFIGFNYSRGKNIVFKVYKN